MEGQIVELVSGEWPAVLLQCSVPCEASDNALPLDGVQFAARERMRQEAPTAAAQTHEDARTICRRFGWTEDVFQQARALGFPSPIGIVRQVRRGEGHHRPVWQREHVDRWLATVRDVIDATK